VDAPQAATAISARRTDFCALAAGGGFLQGRRIRSSGCRVL